jgi:hypothetical protein
VQLAHGDQIAVGPLLFQVRLEPKAPARPQRRNATKAGLPQAREYVS